MNKISQFITFIDFLGAQMGLEHNRSTHFKCILGGSLSLIIVVVSAVIGFLFSMDIYQKKEASVVQNKESISSSIVQLSRFPLVFSMYYNSIGFSDAAFDYINADLVSFDADPYGKINRTVTTNIFRKCNWTEASSQIQELFSFSNSKGFRCIDQPERFYFKNSFVTPNSTYLNFRFSSCNKKQNPNCPDNIIDLVNSLFIAVYHINTYVDSNNYENPLFYKAESIAYQVSYGLIKRIFIRIISGLFLSDNGILLSSISQDNFFILDSLSYDINSQSSEYEGHVLWVTFESPPYMLRYKRNYKKIQDFLASVGGFANALSIIFYFLSKPILRFFYMNFISDLIINDNIIESSKKQKIDKVPEKVERMHESTYQQMIGQGNDCSKPNIILTNLKTGAEPSHSGFGSESKKIQSNNFVSEVS